ncbi:thioredoxin domain-containing protein [Patescibacteria group bacterium]|nr:thioredoxin domain-containing protein [Patescibacteria group bacterium]
MSIAIVIAGALIAAAIYYSGGAATSTGPGAAVAGGEAPEPAAPEIGDIRAVSADDHIRGPDSAKVTIIEYSDLECPFCKRFHPTLQQIVAENPEDVRWVYRHFPLEQIHPNARQAAVAVECAADQGKFWELLDHLFETTETGADLTDDKLKSRAAEVGVADAQQFATCLGSDKHSDRIDADLLDAAAAGGQGTPYSILLGPNGEKIPVSGALPYEAVKAQLDQLL